MSHKNHEKIFCENVKKLRKRHYHSIKTMAEKLGISAYALTQIENEKIPKRLTIDVLFTIENCFGISCADMFKEGSIL